jgi:solute carrier family 35 (UDP-xylose/UDP-N-acetylglucosamine transporter), member B4
VLIWGRWLTRVFWLTGLSFSNAWALEVATSQNPHAGTLITFAQFVLVSIYGLWKHITVAPALTAREDVLRIVAAQIVRLHSRGTAAVGTSRSAARSVYVALEGRTGGAFADELARAIAAGPRALGVGRFSCAGDVKEVAARLDGLWGVPDVPRDAVVLVDGEAHLHAGEFCSRWDYTVFLVSAQDDGVQGSRGRASLTIDVSSQTHPVIVTPDRHPLTVLKSLTRIRLKERSIPISRWAVQVVLFLATSLLNNAAFGYKVPMGVHIIFRSGGLVVNMLMGWLMDGRRWVLAENSAGDDVSPHGVDTMGRRFSLLFW